MKTAYICCILLLVFTLFSCETEIEFEGDEVENVLVLNGFACKDSTIEITLTTSRFFLAVSDTFQKVSNATISLVVNQQYIENLTHIGNGIYKSSYKPQAGDHLKLTASASGYKTITAEDVMPGNISDFEVKKNTTVSDTLFYQETGLENEGLFLYFPSIDSIHHFTLRFKDPVGSEQYYRILAHYGNTDNYSNNYELDMKDNVVFGFNDQTSTEMGFESTEINQFQIFSDELIDGTTHEFQFELKKTMYLFQENGQWVVQDRMYQSNIYIELQTISKAYYLYLKTLEKYMDFEPMFSEPVQIFTNIKSGLGIFGCRNRSIYVTQFGN